jgi:hypothetical protein
MATTTYLEWDDQTTGANNNTWGDVQDANNEIFELAIARVLTLSTTGGSTTLTTAQNRYPIILVTGVLVSNATIIVRTAEKNWTVLNQTTGAGFTVRVKTLAGSAEFVPRGRALKLYCDGTNVNKARFPGIPYALATGTADALAGAYEPVTTSGDIEVGYMWQVEATAANATATPTFAPDGLGPYTIERLGSQALVAGDIFGSGHILLLSYSGASKVELLNPMGAASSTVAGRVQFATVAQSQNMSSSVRAVTPEGLGALFAKGTNVAGAGTISLGDGGYFNITGSGWTCTDIDFTNPTDGRYAALYIVTDGILTHDATTLPLPGAANISLVAGDIVEIWQSNGNEIKVTVERASGRPITETWEFVETLNGSGSTNVNSSSLANYKTLRLTLNNIRPSDDDAEFRIRISSDGSTFLSAGYDGRTTVETTAATSTALAQTDGTVTGTAANDGVGNVVTDGPLTGQIMLNNFNQARKTTIFSNLIYGNPAAVYRACRTYLLNDQSTAMTHLRFTFDTGTVDAGTITIEGLR